VPTLVTYFVESLNEQLETAMGSPLDVAGARLNAEEQNPRRDLLRLYTLADRATHTWVLTALRADRCPAGPDPPALEGLGPIATPDAARAAEHAINAYRQSASSDTVRDALFAVQKCLGVCMGLPALASLPVVTPLLPGARWASRALATIATLCSAASITEEIEATIRVLLAVR